jgi:hypothetical protein
MHQQLIHQTIRARHLLIGYFQVPLDRCREVWDNNPTDSARPQHPETLAREVSCSVSVQMLECVRGVDRIKLCVLER